MKLVLTSDVKRKLGEIKRKTPKLSEKIHKKLELFVDNPKHPSLRNHKLKGNLKEAWSISVEKDLRMLCYFDEDGVIFFDIGTHDQVYNRK